MTPQKNIGGKKSNLGIASLSVVAGMLWISAACSSSSGAKAHEGSMPPVKDSAGQEVAASTESVPPTNTTPTYAPIDSAVYNKAVMHLVHDSVTERWPVKNAPFPLPGAILPFNRVIAYYGNFYSTRMGILGELPPDQMLEKLKGEVRKWEAADPQTKVVPALHYIAVTAQGSAGKDNTYRARMPFAQIDKAIELAKKIDAIVFLDVQVGWSTLQQEIPRLEPYLKMPNVHLGIDPEFSMKTQRKPGTIIGTYDAADVNYVSEYLAGLVKQFNLPPKILVVHRFTRGMLTNYQNIKLRPEVQIVSHMDGWGFPAKKVSSYDIAQVTQPIEYTGFKLFYKNDIKTPPWTSIMTPEQVLKLYPRPVHIQYQ